MLTEKKVQHLNVFLIKSAYDSIDKFVEMESCSDAINISIAGYGVASLYIKSTPPRPPKWLNIFNEFLDPKKFSVAGVAGILALKLEERYFALAFGQGGRFLLKDDVHEERFGLICALNSVDPNSFRCVDIQSLDAIQSHTRIQSGQEAAPNQFDLNIEQDMLKAIVGSPSNHSFGNRMTGNDSLSVAVPMRLSDLPALLLEYQKKFETSLSTENNEWLNNIYAVNTTATIEELEARLEQKFACSDFANVWMSIPEIIDWTLVFGFMYTGGRGEIHTDITLQGFLKTLATGEALSLEILKRRKVICADADHKPVFKSWSAFKCLYAEIDLGDNKFILNDGKWFCVAIDFVKRTDADFKKIATSKLKLPKYSGGGEGQYNKSVAEADPSRYALLDDKKKVMHGGGHGQVEICDLFSIDRELIHVKIYGKSSVFSHLFAQGFISGQLMQIDETFREKVRTQLDVPFKDLVNIKTKPTQDEFTIVYAVISEAPDTSLYLPFFSRANLNNTARILKGFGYKVELLKIDVDSAFSRKIILPTKKRGRSKSKV